MPRSVLVLALVLVASSSASAQAAPWWIGVTGNGVPGTATIKITGGPNQPYAIVVSTVQADQIIGGVVVHVGLELFDLTLTVPGLVGTLDGGGKAVIQVPIPAYSALIGATAYLQAFSIGPVGSWSNFCALTFEAAPGSGPGSGIPAFHHLQGGVAHGVSFLDSQNGWVVEDGGRIRVTHDGGQSWEFQATPDGVRTQLRGVFFLDYDRGWAVGDGGIALRTVNGGSTWSSVIANSSLAALWDVHFTDAMTGFAVGKNAGLFASVDGGATWAPTGAGVLPGHLDLYAVDFPTASAGYVVGDDGIIIRTLDGGQTWSVVVNPCSQGGCATLPDIVELWDVEFVDPQTGFISGGVNTGDGRTLVTTDGGSTWTLLPFVNNPIPGCAFTQGGVTPTLYGVATLPGGAAVAAGYGSKIYVASAAGQPFIDVTPCLATPPLFGADAGGSSDVWVVGMFNTIRHSSDGGQTFSNQAAAETWRLTAGCFANDLTGWIAGQQHRIARTDDGGFSFQEQFQTPADAGFILGMAFANLQAGCAVGQAGFVRYTADGGATWLPGAGVPAADINDVDFASPTTVWAAGAGGRALRSLNGGATWLFATLGAGLDLEAVDFFDPQNGLLVGAGGTAFRWASGAFSPVPTGTSATLRGVAMVSPTDAYAVGDGGIVLHYDGTSFTPVYASPTAAALFTVEVLPSGQVLAAGDFGVVVRFDGSAWSEPKSQTSIPIHAATFLTASTGFLVGQTHVLMRLQPE